ncbi:MAG: RNA methyltransferase [Chloroflexi bacterium]|nr:RNA methyltransferase [Chloroflexota bacterium]
MWSLPAIPATGHAAHAGSPGKRRDGGARRAEHWARIVAEAAEWSSRTRVPLVHVPQTLDRALAAGEPMVFCWEEARGLPFGTAFRRARAAQPAQPGAVRVFVGPEGGFSRDEAERAAAAGAQIATLGARTLRSETAAVAAVAIALLATDE